MLAKIYFYTTVPRFGPSADFSHSAHNALEDASGGSACIRHEQGGHRRRTVAEAVASRAVLYVKCSRYPQIPGHHEHSPIVFARDGTAV